MRPTFAVLILGVVGVCALPLDKPMQADQQSEKLTTAHSSTQNVHEKINNAMSDLQNSTEPMKAQPDTSGDVWSQPLKNNLPFNRNRNALFESVTCNMAPKHSKYPKGSKIPRTSKYEAYQIRLACGRRRRDATKQETF